MDVLKRHAMERSQSWFDDVMCGVPRPGPRSERRHVLRDSMLRELRASIVYFSWVWHNFQASADSFCEVVIGLSSVIGFSPLFPLPRISFMLPGCRVLAGQSGNP